MSTELHGATFWDGISDYQDKVHPFTSLFAESAWKQVALPAGARVLDIAAGTGALAIIAAGAGAQVLATDFSSAMVNSILSYRLPNIAARVMDGEALDLPDASFDAAFSVFGVMLFTNWQAGLAEMARVVRPGGIASVATWKDPNGAAANILITGLCAALFPEIRPVLPFGGVEELRHPDRLDAALVSAGFADVSIVEATHDFPIDEAAVTDPDRLFQYCPIWQQLDAGQRSVILTSIEAAQSVRGGVVPVPSPALIATARRA